MENQSVIIPRPVAGWVYVMESPAFAGAVKVGCTTRTPTERAAELSRGSGVPLPYRVVASRAVADCKTVERQVHRMLADVRVSADREFFHCSGARAVEVINAVADSSPASHQARPLPAFQRRPKPLVMLPAPRAFAVKPSVWKKYRRHWWARLENWRVIFGMVCLVVPVAVAICKPDVSMLPPGHVLRALLFIEGRH